MKRKLFHVARSILLIFLKPDWRILAALLICFISCVGSTAAVETCIWNQRRNRWLEWEGIRRQRRTATNVDVDSIDYLDKDTCFWFSLASTAACEADYNDTTGIGICERLKRPSARRQQKGVAVLACFDSSRELFSLADIVGITIISNNISHNDADYETASQISLTFAQTCWLHGLFGGITGSCWIIHGVCQANGMAVMMMMLVMLMELLLLALFCLRSANNPFGRQTSRDEMLLGQQWPTLALSQLYLCSAA